MIIINSMRKNRKQGKKYRGRCLSLLLALSMLLLAGCGEEVVTLSDAEEAEVTAYAAHVVSKYNKKQPDGISRVLILEEEETETEEETEAPEETEEETPEEEFTDLPTTTGTNMDAIPVGETGSTAPEMELSEVIPIAGFDMQWTGLSVADDYMDPTGATLATPNAGNRYVICDITVTNQTEEDLLCNVAELVPDFRLFPAGMEGITASQMLASTDFPSMNETVPAGESVVRKIFFQRKAADILDSDTYELEVTLNGVSGKIRER